MNIQNKVALVTGGAVRVGKAITLMLAAAGAKVVVHYNTSAAEAETTLAAARALGSDGLALQCDIADDQAVAHMADAVLQHFGGVDILVNSASIFGKMTVPTADLDGWRQVTRISIDGAFFVSNALIPSMLQRGGGAIVNILDLSAWQPWPGRTAHAVGKAGLLALTQQLALELAPMIRVNAVAPGPVLPPTEYSEAVNQAVASRTLLERWGTPEDVAKAVRYLVEADYVTGDVMRVDGGELMATAKARRKR